MNTTLLPGHGRTVCVTGASGFIGAWLVKLLLARGYTVRGTSRCITNDPKNIDHLKALDGAKERLVLLQVDLLDCPSLNVAFKGCEGVFHTASPMHDGPEVLEPVVNGTINVITVAADVGVRRVVFTSTIGTIYMNPHRDPDVVVDESCWSDLEYCRQTKNWYCYAKAIAEKRANQVAGERGVELVIVNPVVVLGPLLQSGINTSILHILKYLTGSAKTYANEGHAYVHVKDVAEAHIKVFEVPDANGRYICAAIALHRGELCAMLADLFPEYPIPNKCKDEQNPRKKGYSFTNQRLKDLGIQFTPLKQCLYETVKSLQEKGLLPLAYTNEVLETKTATIQDLQVAWPISKL